MALREWLLGVAVRSFLALPSSYSSVKCSSVMMMLLSESKGLGVVGYLGSVRNCFFSLKLNSYSRLGSTGT